MTLSGALAATGYLLPAQGPDVMCSDISFKKSGFILKIKIAKFLTSSNYSVAD